MAETIKRVEVIKDGETIQTLPRNLVPVAAPVNPNAVTCNWHTSQVYLKKLSDRIQVIWTVAARQYNGDPNNFNGPYGPEEFTGNTDKVVAEFPLNTKIKILGAGASGVLEDSSKVIFGDVILGQQIISVNYAVVGNDGWGPGLRGTSPAT